MIHGPGTDRGGKDPESDTVFGRILPTSNGISIVEQMKKQPGGSKPNGFINDPSNFIEILSLKMLSKFETNEILKFFDKQSNNLINCQTVENQWKNIQNMSENNEYDKNDYLEKKVYQDIQTILPDYCKEFLTSSENY